MNIHLKPLVTEKAVMMIESQNVLVFEIGKKSTKNEIKKEIESLFSVKVSGVRTLIRGNKKYAYVKLKKEFPAIDVATKLGII
jgi:large subunit ribosomal protein L23